MADTVNAQIVDDITMTNVKVIAGSAAKALADIYAQQPGHSRFMDAMREKLAANVVEGKVSVVEAVGITKLIKGEAEASILSDLSQLDAGQLGQKVANTTPPETGNNSGAYAVQLATALALLQAQANGPSPVPAK